MALRCTLTEPLYCSGVLPLPVGPDGTDGGSQQHVCGAKVTFHQKNQFFLESQWVLFPNLKKSFQGNPVRFIETDRRSKKYLTSGNGYYLCVGRIGKTFIMI